MAFQFRPQQIQVPVGPGQLGSVPVSRRDLPVMINPSVPVSRDLLGNSLPTIATPMPDDKAAAAATMSVPYVDALSGLGQYKPASTGVDAPPPPPPPSTGPSASQGSTSTAAPQLLMPLTIEEQNALIAQSVEAQRAAIRQRYLAEEAQRSKSDTLTALGVAAVATLVLLVLAWVLWRKYH